MPSLCTHLAKVSGPEGGGDLLPPAGGCPGSQVDAGASFISSRPRPAFPPVDLAPPLPAGPGPSTPGQPSCLWTAADASCIYPL